MQHNKRRNSALLYEILVRQLSKAVIEKNATLKENLSQLLKDFFGKGKLLREEKNLYDIILSTKDLSIEQANRFLANVESQYNRFNANQVFNEQSKLISRIHKLIGQESMNTFVPNYKDLATVYNIFHSSKPKEKMILEESVINQLTSKTDKTEMIPIDGFVLKSFMKRFNEHYGDKLLSEQKELIHKYIMSEPVDLISYLNEEIDRLKYMVNKALLLEDIRSDNLLKEKTNKVMETLNSFAKLRPDEKMIDKIMKIQEFAHEIEDSN